MEEKPPQLKLALVERMRNAADAEDYGLFRSFLRDDIVVKVGSTDEIRGAEPAVRFFIDTMTSKIRVTELRITNCWEVGQVAIVEYEMKGSAVDGAEVEFPCVDIYHFDGEKVSEWHVYPMYREFVAR